MYTLDLIILFRGITPVLCHALTIVSTESFGGKNLIEMSRVRMWSCGKQLHLK